MIPEVLAAPVALAAVLLGYQVNHRLVGFLPDDPPRPGRKQHERPMPLAGILLLPATLPWLLWSGLWWLAGAVTLAAVLGFVDDRGKEHGRDLDWRLKTIALLAAAALAAWPLGDPLADPLRAGVAVLLLFVLCNATNFLDNTDGVAAALSAVSILFATGGTGPLAAGGYAAVGILVCNWPRPLVFLGDAGAYLLGLWAAAALLQAPTPHGDEWLRLLPAAVQLADFVQVVIARLVLGVAPWIGDRRHLTHIVQNLGLPRWLVAPLFAAVAAVLALAGSAL